MKNISKRLTLVEIGQLIQAVAILVIILILLSSCSNANPFSPDFIGNKMLEPFQTNCEFAEVVSVDTSIKGCTYTLSDGLARMYEICQFEVGDVVATGSCE